MRFIDSMVMLSTIMYFCMDVMKSFVGSEVWINIFVCKLHLCWSMYPRSNRLLSCWCGSTRM